MTEQRAWKGLSPVVLDEWGVTVRPDGRVELPYRDADGRVHNVRVVAAGRQWWRTKGLDLIPYGLDRLARGTDAASRMVIVAEGESDTLGLAGAFAGAQVDFVGLPGATTWRAEWAEHLEPYRCAYVVGDGDDAGRRMIDAVIRDLTNAWPVLLPHGEDARSMLQRFGPRALDPYLADADRRALLWEAFTTARTLGEAEAMLGGREELRAA